MKVTIPLIMFCLLLGCGSVRDEIVAEGSRQAGSAKPNIVFIFADDLGYGEIQAFNPERGKIATPQLNKLAEEGMMFTDMHSASSVCSPSRYALLTGRYTWRTRLQKGVIIKGGDKSLIADGRITLASMLREQGYNTGAVGKWHLDYQYQDSKTGEFFKPNILPDRRSDAAIGSIIPDGPISRGFDYFYGYHHALIMKTLVENDRVVETIDIVDMLPRISQKSVEFIDQHAADAKAGKPFFLYVPLSSPHEPFEPTNEWQDRSGLGTYADFVMQTDAVAGEIVNAIDRNDLADNTIVVFTSDNGTTNFANASELEKQGHYSSARLRGSKSDLWDGGHRVPFILRWPAVVQAGSETPALVGLNDVMRTLAELLDVDLPDNAAEDSISFLPTILGNAAEQPRENIIHHSGPGKFSFRQGKWKLLLAPGSGGKSSPRDIEVKEGPRIQLYDLSQDIGEQHNLQAEYPQVVEQLLAQLKRQVEAGRSTPGEPQSNDLPNESIDLWKRAALQG